MFEENDDPDMVENRLQIKPRFRDNHQRQTSSLIDLEESKSTLLRTDKTEIFNE